ncbi:MAG: hypothetical protein WBB54_09630 [Mycobacterium sp.]
MNISLRSQMTAGVAALSAAVVAVAPITQPDLLPSAERIAAAIQLSAFSNPVIAITDNIFFATGYFLDQDFVSDNIVWPDTFVGEFLYAPLNVGIIPDLANQFSTGPLSGLINNLGGYGFAGVTTALVLVDGVARSVFNAPFAVVAAVEELIAGDPEAALQALRTGIIEPLQLAVEQAAIDVGYIVDNIIENIQIGFITLPRLVAGVVGAAVANVSLILESLADTAASFVANLAALNIEGAWNDVVDGILGSGGTLGQIVELTVGLGLGEFVNEDDFVMTNPSIRSVLTSELQRLGSEKFLGDGGITNDPLFGFADATAAVTEPAPVAAVQVSAPAVALESAPAVVEAPAVPEAVVEAPAVPKAVVEAPAPVSEPAATTEVADVAAPAVRESVRASAAPRASARKSRVGDDSAVSTGTSAETDTSTGAGTPDSAGPTGATAGDSGSVNESSAPKKSSPRGSKKAAAAASSAG